MEKARCNTELYSNLRAPLNNVKPSNFWGSHQKGQLLFFLGVVREVQEDNNGKLNPSHFVGPSRSQGHGRPWFSLCYPPEPLQRILK